MTEFWRPSAGGLYDSGANQRRAGGGADGGYGDTVNKFAAQNMPPVFVCPSAQRGKYGFPNEQNPYAKLSPNSPPEYLLVLVELKPR